MGTTHSSPARSPNDRPENEAWYAADSRLTNPRWPFIFVLLSLVALGGLPFLTIGTIAIYRRDIRRIESARDLTADQFESLALAGGYLRDYVATHDAELLKRYHAAIADDVRARHRLRPLMRGLPPDVQQRYDDAVRTHSAWQQRMAALLYQLPTSRIEPLLVNETLYQRCLISTAALDRALSQAGEARRNEIDRAQRVALTLTAALLILASAAAAAVGWLGRRLRAFAVAEEAHRRELQNVLANKERTTRGITHDMKNPLGVIVGQADLLEEGVHGELNPRQREDIGRIKRVALSLLGLLDEMLELSRAESGTIRIDKAPVDLRGLITDVCDSYRPTIEQAGLSLETAVDDSVARVVTDRARVTQVLGNLLSNAAKYTTSGGVEVHAEVGNGGAPTPGHWVAVRVSDTGRGIPPERQEQIFAEFSRLESETVDGTGLGLAMSRNLARLLGGDITVQSQVGQGSTFTFWLPC